MKIQGDRVIFSSGKEKYSNNGIIGLSPEMTVTEGYDGGLYNPKLNDPEWMEEAEVLSEGDLCELADYMIGQWQKFKTLHSNKHPNICQHSWEGPKGAQDMRVRNCKKCHESKFFESNAPTY